VNPNGPALVWLSDKFAQLRRRIESQPAHAATA